MHGLTRRSILTGVSGVVLITLLALGAGVGTKRPQARADSGSGGDPVARTDKWTNSSQSWLNADGTLTLKTWAGPIQTFDSSSGTWSPIVTTLQSAAGG